MKIIYANNTDSKHAAYLVGHKYRKRHTETIYELYDESYGIFRHFHDVNVDTRVYMLGIKLDIDESHYISEKYRQIVIIHNYSTEHIRGKVKTYADENKSITMLAIEYIKDVLNNQLLNMNKLEKATKLIDTYARVSYDMGDTPYAFVAMLNTMSHEPFDSIWGSMCRSTSLVKDMITKGSIIEHERRKYMEKQFSENGYESQIGKYECFVINIPTDGIEPRYIISGFNKHKIVVIYQCVGSKISGLAYTVDENIDLVKVFEAYHAAGTKSSVKFYANPFDFPLFSRGATDKYLTGANINIPIRYDTYWVNGMCRMSVDEIDLVIEDMDEKKTYDKLEREFKALVTDIRRNKSVADINSSWTPTKMMQVYEFLVHHIKNMGYLKSKGQNEISTQ